MARGPSARIWVAMPRLGALPVGGILPRDYCSRSLIRALLRPVMASTAITVHAGCRGFDGGDGCVPDCGGGSDHVRLHHLRLDPAASTGSPLSRCLQPATFIYRIVKAVIYCELNSEVWLIDLQKIYLPCAGEAERFPDILTVRNLLDLSVVLQATPAHAGVGRNWYCLYSTFFCSAPDDICDSVSGVSADAPGMDMMLDSLVSKNGTLRTMQLMDTQYLDVSAALCWEYQNWNNALSVNPWSQVNITDEVLEDNYVYTQQISFKSSNNLSFRILRPQIDLNAEVYVDLELICTSIMATTIGAHEQHFLRCCSCTCFSLSHDRHVEDAVFVLFGLCHRRCTTTPPLLILRFNSANTPSLSLVKVIRYLQLNSTPRVHISDRPLGEPPAGHQLDRTSTEAFEDCRCSNFESGLSTDERTLYGSICDL